MIGLDTNILVRYLTQDDPFQSPKATEIIERRLTEEAPGFVSIVAMVETVWVLDRAYGLSAHKIATAVERMLQTDVLVIENEQEVFTAMIALKEGQGSFADSVIAALGVRAGCSCTLTFDHKAARLRTPLTCLYTRALARIIRDFTGEKRKDALKGVMNTGF
jgi:predicted nucleic-acid-binding protein